MGGKAPKRKGNKFESEIVELLRDGGIDAHRVPLSGAVSTYPGDVKFQCQGEWVLAECKRRKAGFKTLYGWLGANTILFIRDDKCEPLVVMRAKDFAKLAVLS